MPWDSTRVVLRREGPVEQTCQVLMGWSLELCLGYNATLVRILEADRVDSCRGWGYADCGRKKSLAVICNSPVFAADVCLP